jgi:uncharacterized protein YegJ (DUF2314 family)
MMQNYFNPEAARPGLGQGSPLEAFFAPEQMDRYRQMMGLQQQMASQQIDRTGMENETYRLDAAPRAEERIAKQSGFQLQDMGNRARLAEPNYGPTMARGEMGPAMSHYAKGQVDQGTVQSNIAKTNSGNEADTLINIAHTLQMQASSSPTMAQSTWAQIHQKLPPQVQQMLPAQYSPEVPAMLNKFAEAAKNSPAHGRQMDQTRMTTEAQIKIGEGNNEATKYAADQRYAAAYLKLPSTTRNKIESVMADIMEKVAAGTATDKEMSAAMWIQQVMYNNKAAATAGTIDPNALMYFLMSQAGRVPAEGPNRGTPKPVPAPGAKPEAGTAENPIVIK